MKALATIVVVTASIMAGPAKAIEQAGVHLDCMAIYSLLRMAAPTFAEWADERTDHARRAYFRDLPFPLPRPMPMTSGEIEAQIGVRVQERGTRLADAETDEEVRRETDAFLADIHGCDAQYGLDPTPAPWRD